MKYIKSPLNYIGGKYKLLPVIISTFPPKIKTFVDLFAGGFNVGINVNADKIICNDQITYLIDLYRIMKKTETCILVDQIKSRIEAYNLNQQNTDGYNKLRDLYNEKRDILDLFILSCYSFNHQIRFNNKHKFNTPFGKNRSSFNINIERNLIEFCDALHDKNVIFENKDFLSVDLLNLTREDFVYCDPPYRISTGSYNDGKRGFKDWTEKEDRELLDLLDRLNERGIRFTLSNVLYHKGLTNELLIEWSKNYQILYLDKNYSNCNYQFKNSSAQTVEVLIMNYDYRQEGCNNESNQEHY